MTRVTCHHHPTTTPSQADCPSRLFDPKVSVPCLHLLDTTLRRLDLAQAGVREGPILSPGTLHTPKARCLVSRDAPNVGMHEEGRPVCGCLEAELHQNTNIAAPQVDTYPVHPVCQALAEGSISSRLVHARPQRGWTEVAEL